jgi:hypothetical protein
MPIGKVLADPDTRAFYRKLLAECLAVGQAAGAKVPNDWVDDRMNFSDNAPGLIPIGVGRSVELPRPLTDAEWHRLVSDLRETFDARGKLSEHGPFKQWTNGNLQALLEPTPDGQRLRLKTLKGSALSMMGTGAMMLGITAAIWVSMMLRAAPFDGDAFGVLMLTGLGLLIGGVVPLPSWARARQRQMEEIVERLSLISTTTKPDEEPGADER